MARIGDLPNAPIATVVMGIVLMAGTALAAPVGYDGDIMAPTRDATPTGTGYMLTETWGGDFSDSEKSPVNSDDDNLCWGSTASNILDWTGWGHVDDGTGHVLSSADEIFSYIQNHWTDEGGMMSFAWDWWFDGVNDSQGSAGWAQVDVPGGGFHSDENFLDYFYQVSDKPQAMPAIDAFLRSGFGVGAAIYRPRTGGGLYGHSLTLWGVNVSPDDPSNYLGIWVTDSDDAKHLTNPPDQLRYYEVELTAGQWHLQSYDNRDTWYVGTVQALAVPEPTTTALLGLGLLLARPFRRRGKHGN